MQWQREAKFTKWALLETFAKRLLLALLQTWTTISRVHVENTISIPTFALQINQWIRAEQNKNEEEEEKYYMPLYTCPSLLIWTFLLSFQGLSKWCANWKGRLSFRIHSTLNTPPSPAEPQSWLFSLPISEDILENPCG